jgi:hypothetical protein
MAVITQTAGRPYREFAGIIRLNVDGIYPA